MREQRAVYGLNVHSCMEQTYLLVESRQAVSQCKEKATDLTTEDRTTRVGTLIVATIYLQLIQSRYMFRSFTVLQCSHQHCIQPVASDEEVVGYL